MLNDEELQQLQNTLEKSLDEKLKPIREQISQLNGRIDRMNRWVDKTDAHFLLANKFLDRIEEEIAEMREEVKIQNARSEMIDSCAANAFNSLSNVFLSHSNSTNVLD